jgi:uncharacterized linocin/CFP29 family protein
MDPLTLVGRAQAPLREEEWKQLDEAVVRAAQPVLVGRRVLPVKQLAGVGVMTIDWDELSEMSAAHISMYGETPAEDTIIYTRKSLNVPILHKDFRIHWRDLEASRRFGTPLDTANAESAALVVAQKEDRLILNGEVSGELMLGIEGLTTATGRQTQASGGAWATSPNALTDVRAAAKKLLDKYYPPPYDLIVQPSAFMDAHTLIANTGISQVEKITELIQGNIYISSQLKASDGGTDSAILIKSGAENADLCVAQDLKTFYMQTVDMNHHFKVYEAVVPRIKRPTAICEITGIT